MPRKPAPPTKTPLRPSLSLEELLFVAIIALAGFGLRIANPERMAVEHFDEGVYTSHLWFQENPGDDPRYPDRFLYAPPLLPVLASWSMAVLGPSHLGTMLVSLLAGTLTIVAMWWTARRWFGLEAGLASGLLAALSDFHILYSRTVLTDVLLGLWLLLAVYFVWKAFDTRRPMAILAAGAFTGLAWWTKYNGWLPLAIGLAGVIPWLVLDRPRTESKWKPVAVWLAVACVAVVVWSPVWFQIQNETPDGYSAVAANHTRYVVGLGGWWDSFVGQVGNHRLLNGWLSAVGLGAAVLVAMIAGAVKALGGSAGPSSQVQASRELHRREPVDGGEPRRSPGPVVAGAAAGLLLVALSAALGSTVVLGLLAACGIALQLWRGRRTDPARQREQSLAVWLVAAWFVGLLVATPLYRPYPRLSLPWLMAAWLGTSALIGWGAERLRSTVGAKGDFAQDLTRGRTGATAACIALSIGLLVWFGGELSERGVPGWQSRAGLASISEQILHDAGLYAETIGRPSGSVPYIAYVYAEPALVFHLTSAGAVAPPAGNLGFVPPAGGQPEVPTFLVTGPHAHRSEPLREEWSRVGDRFELIATYPYEPSTFVLLNHYPPPAVASSDVPQHEVRLYRVR